MTAAEFTCLSKRSAFNFLLRSGAHGGPAFFGGGVCGEKKHKKFVTFSNASRLWFETRANIREKNGLSGAGIESEKRRGPVPGLLRQFQEKEEK